MKTPQQWAEHLPEPIKTEFLENIKYGCDEQFKSLSNALDMCIFWAQTPQGHSYWHKVYNRAKDGEFQPALISEPIDKSKETEVFTKEAENLLTGLTIVSAIGNHITFDNGLMITIPNDTIQELNEVAS